MEDDQIEPEKSPAYFPYRKKNRIGDQLEITLTSEWNKITLIFEWNILTIL